MTLPKLQLLHPQDQPPLHRVSHYLKLLPEILLKYDVQSTEIGYIGDDVNDIDIMKSVGFSATPSDGNFQVKKISDYVCDVAGGKGAFREFADLIIKSK